MACSSCSHLQPKLNQISLGFFVISEVSRRGGPLIGLLSGPLIGRLIGRQSGRKAVCTQRSISNCTSMQMSPLRCGSLKARRICSE